LARSVSFISCVPVGGRCCVTDTIGVSDKVYPLGRPRHIPRRLGQRAPYACGIHGRRRERERYWADWHYADRLLELYVYFCSVYFCSVSQISSN
jgi:hypothetical protein